MVKGHLCHVYDAKHSRTLGRTTNSKSALENKHVVEVSFDTFKKIKNKKYNSNIPFVH
jgi:hypothetical protein